MTPPSPSPSPSLTLYQVHRGLLLARRCSFKLNLKHTKLKADFDPSPGPRFVFAVDANLNDNIMPVIFTGKFRVDTTLTMSCYFKPELLVCQCGQCPGGQTSESSSPSQPPPGQAEA